MTSFRYAERLPSPVLRPWLASYWEFVVHEGAPPLHHVPPDGCTSIMMVADGPSRGFMLVSGPWLKPLAVPVAPGTRYVGVRIRPGATRTILGIDPAITLNASIPADVAVAELAPLLRERLLLAATFDEAVRAFDAFWTEAHARFEPVDTVVDRAVQAIIDSNGEQSVAGLAHSLSVPERTLLRRFKAATALTPKQFARIRRLLTAAWQVVDGMETWGQIAAHAGYADQPHLHHDVARLTGLRPDDFGNRIRATQHDGVMR